MHHQNFLLFFLHEFLFRQHPTSIWEKYVLSSFYFTAQTEISGKRNKEIYLYYHIKEGGKEGIATQAVASK